jgi:hypothetical protein
MRVIPLLAALAIGEVSLAQRAETALQPGTSALDGAVLDVLSKEPIKGCTVTVVHLVNFRPSGGGVTTTGPGGTYSFNAIAGGEYALNVSCAGYLPTCYRDPRVESPRCETVGVAVDQRKSNIDFHIVPEAKARGRVVDANGRPVPSATVRLGAPVGNAPFVMVKPTQTDRDGAFELSNLPAGEWQLEVEVPGTADAPRPPTIYFPGVLTSADAGSIELVAGKTLHDILVVAPPLEDNRMTVRVVMLEQAATKVDLSLVRVEPLMSRRIAVDDTGSGTVTGLAPGRYYLSARGYSNDGLSVAFDAVDFIGDSQETLLHMQPSSRIAGRIIGDRGATPSLDGVRVGAAWFHDGVEINPQAVDEAAVAPDGSFQFDGLFGTRQLRLFGLDPDFEVRSITQGRTDVTAGFALAAGAQANVVIVVGRR